MTSTSVYSDMASFLCCKASFSSFDCSFNFSWASHKSLVGRKNDGNGDDNEDDNDDDNDDDKYV